MTSDIYLQISKDFTVTKISKSDHYVFPQRQEQYHCYTQIHHKHGPDVICENLSCGEYTKNTSHV